MANSATFRIWRSDGKTGRFEDYATPISEGMVVLDAIHQIQANQANDLAVRWNCKAGKCGSCSAEVNGNPRLMCMTRLNQLDLSEPVTVEPMRSFPLIKDLVTDVSWNFRAKLTVKPFRPGLPMRRMERGACFRPTSSGCRNFGSASSVFSARTCATFCGIIICSISSWDPATSFTRQLSRCTRSTRAIA